MKPASELTALDIRQAFRELTENESEVVLALMQRRLTGDFFSSVEKWVAQCHNAPSKDERRLCALNQLTEGHGTEAIKPDDEVYPKMVYVNQGDTYTTTILHDLETNEFLLGCWGDWLEKWEQENPRKEEEAEDSEEEDANV